ncbi:MAG: proteasome assembly chaperone family protein [Halobacteriota archaeon]
MAQIELLNPDIELDSPAMVEGLPGVGLVGKIAADHLVDVFEMERYANVHCDALPKVTIYEEGDSSLRTPVQLYADADRDLLVLHSDIPISSEAANEFATCMRRWFDEQHVLPIYLSGLPRKKTAEVPSVYGVGVGAGVRRLADMEIHVPTETGLISGPTGALLSHAVENELDAIGLVVESDPRFPDPEASRVVIKDGVEKLLDVEVPVADLVEHAEEIRNAREQLAKQMQQADEESTKARPLRMYQ